MIRGRNAGLAAGIALALAWIAAGTAQAAEGEAIPDHAGHETRLIGVTAGRLIPESITLGHRDAFGWLNYSSRAVSIAFRQEVVPHLLCTAPTRFAVKDGRLIAHELEPGAFATLCQLAPGRYDYRVEVASRTPGGESTTLEGQLVVRAAALP